MNMKNSNKVLLYIISTGIKDPVSGHSQPTHVCVRSFKIPERPVAISHEDTEGGSTMDVGRVW